MSKVPTQWPVKYKCGHTERRDLSNVPPTKRRRAAESDFWSTKAGRAGDGLVCKKCFGAERSQDKEQRMRQWMLDIEQFESDHDLPKLQGTLRQLDSGLVDSARRDRHSVLSALLDDEETEYPERREEILAAVHTLNRAGWWTGNLGFNTRRDFDYGQEEYVELVLDGAQQEAKREDARIENENPHAWAGDE